MPLIAGKLTFTDCIPLIEKITAKIRSWTARHLSFSGRVQLIQMYWSSIFIFPKKLVKAIEQNLINSCGKGAEEVSKCHGSKFVFLKKEEGLGLKRVEDWNKAALMKHIWNPFTQAGSLWVAWVYGELLKGRSFWTVKIPQECSWGWKKLMKLRTEARSLLSHEVGYGSNIFLWHDRWHPNGVLYQMYG
jgi:hypothetical protein